MMDEKTLDAAQDAVDRARKAIPDALTDLTAYTITLMVEVKRLREWEACLPPIPVGADPTKLSWWCGTDEQWLNLRASIVRNGDKPVGLTADVLRAALEAE